MADLDSTLCFSCGLALGDPPRLNHLPNGSVCPACRDRLLESLPSILPTLEPAEEVEASEATDSEIRAEAEEEEPREALSRTAHRRIGPEEGGPGPELPEGPFEPPQPA